MTRRSSRRQVIADVRTALAGGIAVLVRCAPPCSAVLISSPGRDQHIPVGAFSLGTVVEPTDDGGLRFECTTCHRTVALGKAEFDHAYDEARSRLSKVTIRAQPLR